jgi:hypothetical protein
MYTQHMILTLKVSGFKGGVTCFWNTPSHFTVLKKGCFRMLRVSPCAPSLEFGSTIMNWNSKRELVYGPITSSVPNMTVARLETNCSYPMQVVPINKYGGEFHCGINGINVGIQCHGMWLVSFAIIPSSNPENSILDQFRWYTVHASAIFLFRLFIMSPISLYY